MSRPRKVGSRKPCGRLVQVKKDDRYLTAQYRERQFGVHGKQIINPLAGYLAGVLFLRGRIEAFHLGHFYSFLQMVPDHLRSVPLGEHVQGGHYGSFQPMSQRYMVLARELKSRINYLHALAHDQLVCPVNTLKSTLEVVPLTRGGVLFTNWCETHDPRISR